MPETLELTAKAGRKSLVRVLLAAALILATATAITAVVRALNQQREDALMIDVAGRQRMLSQELAKDALLGSLGNDTEYQETRAMLVRTAERLAKGGTIQVRSRNRELPAPESEVIRQRLEMHRDAIDRQTRAADHLLLTDANDAGYQDALQSLLDVTNSLHFELDDTVRRLSDGSAAETAAALKWALASVVLVVALCALLVGQTFRSGALDRRLRASEERLQLAVLGSNDGLWDWDLVTDQVHYSRRFKRLLGFDDGDFSPEGGAMQRRVHPDDHERVAAAIYANINERIPFDEECRLQSKDGSYSFFRVRGRAVWDETGRAVRMAGAITDIGAQKAAEVRLARSAQEARLVHLTTSMAADTDSLHEALQSCVDSVCETTGWPVGHAYVPERTAAGVDVLGSARIWHLHGGDRYQALREVSEGMTFERGIGLPGRIWNSGEPAWIKNVQKDENFPRARLRDQLDVKGAFGFPIKVRSELVAILEFFAEEEMDPDPDLLLTVASVGEQLGRVIERKRGSEELRRARDDAQEANRAKSQFLANMSHELRTPLNSVIGFSNVLLRGIAASLPEKERTFLERIRDNGVHLLSLINEVLDISKIEAGKMEVHIDSVDLEAVVAEVCADLEVTASEKGLALSSELASDLAPILADGARLKQVLINLVANALKFTEEGGVTVRVLAAAGTRVPERIEVVDTGIGISKQQLPSVFDSFQQADASSTRRFGGSGLGLAISRSLCRLMGFELTAVSEPGRGSTFIVALEGVRGSRLDETPSTDSFHAMTVDRQVLIIDDDPDTRVLLSEHLGELGCEVKAVASGEEGLTAARQWGPDLITLDLMMPGMSGWEVLHRLKSDDELSDIPVVVVSIVAAENRGTLLGAVDALSKPIQRKDLKRLLARILGNGTSRALVVEDNPDSRRLLVELLREEGLQVVEANNGAEALEMLEAVSPDLVILDLLMPAMDGTEFLARLREDSKHIDLPVVVVTAKELSTAEGDFLERQGAAVLRKGEDLEKRLKKAVFRRLRRGDAVGSES